MLAKRVYPGHIDDYDDARTFDVYPVSASNIEDIARLLVRLIAVPRCCVIRGELIEQDNRRGVRRLLYDDAETGARAAFGDVPRQWLALDVEKIARPAQVSVTDLPS